MGWMASRCRESRGPGYASSPWRAPPARIPSSVARSAMRTSVPPEIVIAASPSDLRRAGRGFSSSARCSTSSAIVRAWMIPASRQAASNMRCEPARTAVWVRTASAPARERPSLRATIRCPARRPAARARRDAGRRRCPRRSGQCTARRPTGSRPPGTSRHVTSASLPVDTRSR